MGEFMYKSLIKNYALNITKEKILTFASNNNISLTNKDLNVIYNSIKNDIDIILSDKCDEYLETKKDVLSKEVYLKILEYKKKYLKYLN